MRGGFGIFYDSRVMGMLSNRFVDEWPFSPQFILSTAATALPAPFPPPARSVIRFAPRQPQVTLKCNGVQASSYPTFPSPFPAPTNFPYNPPFNEIAVSYDPSGTYHVPTEYEWNLTVERQLASQMVARLAYVGSHSINILETQDFNPGG